MGIWFVSDTHFGHKLAAKDRGFEHVEAHDAVLLRTFMRTFQENDDVWWLGDLAFDGWQHRIELWDHIPGRHHLVLGNHDRAHPLHSQGQNYQPHYHPYFSSVQIAARVSYDGAGALLSHFPYDGDHGDLRDRFSEWRLKDTGKPLIHGHTHGKEQLTYSSAGTPQVHVGLDAWGLKPVSAFEVFELIRSA